MIEPIVIVPMAQNHLDDVLTIEAQCSANPWPGSTFIAELRNPTHILLVAKTTNTPGSNKSEVVGFAGGQIIADELHVHSLSVHKDWRSKNIGRTLIENLLASSRLLDVKSATLEVRISNDIAIALYTKLGFEKEGIRSKYYADNGEDAVIMWLHSIREYGGIK